MNIAVLPLGVKEDSANTKTMGIAVIGVSLLILLTLGSFASGLPPRVQWHRAVLLLLSPIVFPCPSGAVAACRTGSVFPAALYWVADGCLLLGSIFRPQYLRCSGLPGGPSSPWPAGVLWCLYRGRVVVPGPPSPTQRLVFFYNPRLFALGICSGQPLEVVAGCSLPVRRCLTVPTPAHRTASSAVLLPCI